MKILFQRRTISYSIENNEVTRVIRGEELDDNVEASLIEGEAKKMR